MRRCRAGRIDGLDAITAQDAQTFKCVTCIMGEGTRVPSVGTWSTQVAAIPPLPTLPTLSGRVCAPPPIYLTLFLLCTRLCSISDNI
jgi:hypothetical protein